MHYLPSIRAKFFVQSSSFILLYLNLSIYFRMVNLALSRAQQQMQQIVQKQVHGRIQHAILNLSKIGIS